MLVARLAWKRSVGETVIGALSAGQVNSNNIGIPLSLYLLGSAAYPAPVILLQLLVFTPIAMAILDAVTSGRSSLVAQHPPHDQQPDRRRLGARNPGVGERSRTAADGHAAGTAHRERLRADHAHQLRDLAARAARARRTRTTAGRRAGQRLKLFAMPVIAWVLAEFVFGLSPHDVLIVTVLAALPTAQNVFNYSQRFGVGEVISRDTMFLTTIGCVPILIAITLLLG